MLVKNDIQLITRTHVRTHVPIRMIKKSIHFSLPQIEYLIQEKIYILNQMNIYNVTSQEIYFIFTLKFYK